MSIPSDPNPRLRRLRLSIADLAGLVVLAAVVCRWPVLATWAIPAVAILVMKRAGFDPDGRFASHLGLLSAAVYIPCLLLLLGIRKYYWNQTWFDRFPLIPGLFPANLAVSMLSRSFNLPLPRGDTFQLVLAAALTWIGLGSLAFIALRSNRLLLACLVIAPFYWLLVLAMLIGLVRA